MIWRWGLSTCNKMKAGRDTPHWQEGKLVRIHRRKAKHEVGRLYDLLKNLCLRSTPCFLSTSMSTFGRSQNLLPLRLHGKPPGLDTGSLVIVLKHWQKKKGRYSHFHWSRQEVGHFIKNLEKHDSDQHDRAAEGKEKNVHVRLLDYCRSGSSRRAVRGARLDRRRFGTVISASRHGGGS